VNRSSKWTDVKAGTYVIQEDRSGFLNCIRQIIVRVGSGGVETEVRAQSDDVSNAANLLWANCEPFEAEAGNIRGSYLLRFLDGLTILAEGRFVLK